MNYYCPDCKEVICDLTRKICGICAAALPRETLRCMAQAETLHEKAAELRRAVSEAAAKLMPKNRSELMGKT